MRNLDIVTLRSLNAIAQHGGVTKAAEALHLTQSAISQHIKRLENQLGIKLFARQGRAITLTQQGSEFLEQANKILGLNDRIVEHYCETATEQIISIGLSEHISHAYLPEILSTCSKIPKIRLDVRVGLNNPLFADLKEGRLDIAILVNERNIAQIKPAAHQQVQWVSGHKFEDRADKPLPIVLYGGPCLFRTLMLSTLDACRIPWELSYSASSLADLKAALHAKMGYSALLDCEIGSDLFINRGTNDRLPQLPNVDVIIHTKQPTESTVKQLLEVLTDKVFGLPTG
jgi:DNA-binding transcriptional LysR family regulator